MAAIEAINVDCPACGRELPTIPIATRQARVPMVDHDPIRHEVVLTPDLTPMWWLAARADHPECVLE